MAIKKLVSAPSKLYMLQRETFRAMIFSSDFISTSRIILHKTPIPEDLDHRMGTLSSRSIAKELD